MVVVACGKTVRSGRFNRSNVSIPECASTVCLSVLELEKIDCQKIDFEFYEESCVRTPDLLVVHVKFDIQLLRIDLPRLRLLVVAQVAEHRLKDDRDHVRLFSLNGREKVSVF